MSEVLKVEAFFGKRDAHFSIAKQAYTETLVIKRDTTTARWWQTRTVRDGEI